MASPVVELSQDVLQTLDRWKVPVDPFQIAKDEEIELAPGDYGDGFDARIEYVPEIKRFAIYYRPTGPGWPQGRVNFSIAHELGHFYIPHHRERLLKGEMHNSFSDFRSSNEREQEADEFAANLLMPRELFISEVHRFRQRICTLKEIAEMADSRFNTSVMSTARRYCQCDIEACSVVVSEKGIVRWAMHSEDMKRLNMRYVAAGRPVPSESRSAVFTASNFDPNTKIEGLVDSDVWFERPFYKKQLWEEAMLLGSTGFALTYLTLDSEP
jgi:hypothetical protein